MYCIVTGVTSDIGVPSTYLVSFHFILLIFDAIKLFNPDKMSEFPKTKLSVKISWGYICNTQYTMSHKICIQFCFAVIGCGCVTSYVSNCIRLLIFFKAVLLAGAMPQSREVIF